jgi:hypothetical protein
MKKKVSRIVGVAATIVLLSSLLAFAAPVAGGNLGFSDQTIPSTTGVVLAPGKTISDMAANGERVYAAMGAARILYKSVNTGSTWSTLSYEKATTSFPYGMPVNLVAVAPDDPDTVVFATANNTVEYSVNGGSSWTNLGQPGSMTIRCIDISEAASGIRYLAVGGNAGSSAVVYTMKLATGETWASRASTANGFASGQTEVNAVKWSPGFEVDKILGVVSSDGTTPRFQVMWYESPYKWNSQVTGYDDYMTGITIDQTLTGQLDSASIGWFPEYIGSDPDTRIVFIGLAQGTAGGVFRLIDDNQDKEVTSWTAATVGPVRSVVYDGVKLIAGDYNDARVYVDTGPMDTTPKFDRVRSYKQPGGEGPVIVGMAGEIVVAACGGDQGGFSISTDDGVSFNDISLINTELTHLRDVTPSMDNSNVYLSTDDGTHTSIWLQASDWKRVLSIMNDTNYIVRVSPNDQSVVYVADVGGNAIYWSSDAGEENWKKRPCYKLDDLVDMVVLDDVTAVAIDLNESSKTTNGAISWGTAKSLGITGGMITSAPNDDLIVGGADGFVAYSIDGAATWKKCVNMVGGDTGNVKVVADVDYEDNSYIYATTDSNNNEGIYRGTADTQTKWYASSDHGITLPAGAEPTGIGRYNKVLYVIWTDGTDSYLERCLSPASTPPYYATSKKSAGEVFNVGPQALKISDGVILWAICTSGTDELYALTDSIATVGPTLNAPEDKIEVATNPATGRAYNIAFNFDRPSSKVDTLQLQVAEDSAFKGLVFNKADISTSSTTKAVVVGPFGDMGYTAEFMPGGTYYWRVRVSKGGPFYSPWSEVRTFMVAEVEVIEPVTVTQQPAPTLTIEQAPAPTITVDIPPTPAPVSAIPAYMLWIIIVIGAVLVIALIILIVRTRRAV